jgi:pilus assembly protein CpaE
MKIKVLYNDATRFEFIRRAVAEKSSGADISGSLQADNTLPALINGSAPDVLIVDDATRANLNPIESLSLVSPGIDILLVSTDTSAEFLMNAMRAGVREVIPSSASQDILQAALARIMHKRGKHPSGNDGKVFAFLSCKGGSGATFLAANFAYVLAHEFGRRVALILKTSVTQFRLHHL